MPQDRLPKRIDVDVVEEDLEDQGLEGDSAGQETSGMTLGV